MTNNQLPFDFLSLLYAQQNNPLVDATSTVSQQPQPASLALGLPAYGASSLFQPQPDASPTPPALQQSFSLSAGIQSQSSSALDLSGIDSEVIRQVREEYQAKMRAQQAQPPPSSQLITSVPTLFTYDASPPLPQTNTNPLASFSELVPIQTVPKPKPVPTAPIKSILKRRPPETVEGPLQPNPVIAAGRSRRPVASAALARASSGVDVAVLARLDEIAMQGRVFDVVRGLKRAQASRENQLFADRQVLVERHEAERDHLLARELIGLVSVSDVETFENKASNELRTMDERVVAEIDREVSKQQISLAKLGIPSFAVTSDPDILKMQMKVLKILVEMIPG
ncbi:DiGeorge syndrome critical region 6 protein-domain-containing protein [Jimgerdemannia flammicorona]|uniref:DiGeorge syndrome critical region 6 protein-domain-containing protein n=1 Tax=Jimgerdemannia flammicorona TaxID=994334 RepID=A0A433Q1V5_9FUNG|nr:DiGeorge syndrome critical region 6 protein-domain-containing protein [Jimgerdemannia flammicorona]